MLGIMRKDFFETFCIKKNLIEFVFGIVALVICFILMPSKYITMLIVALSVPLMSVSPLQYSIERDEISKFDQILMTFPISKKTIVATKFLETYIFALICFLGMSLPIVLLAIYYYSVLTLQEGILLLLISLIFSLIVLPILNVGFMTLGNKKGLIIYVIISLLFGICYIAIGFMFGVEQLLRISLYRWLIYGGLVALISNILGYFICLKIYDKKHS